MICSSKFALVDGFDDRIRIPDDFLLVLNCFYWTLHCKSSAQTTVGNENELLFIYKKFTN